MKMSKNDDQEMKDFWASKASRLPRELAWEQALRGALAAGGENEGELATTYVEFEFHLQSPCGSPSTGSDFRQSARGGNERECEQTLKDTWQG